jgi:hypothetical protein
MVLDRVEYGVRRGPVGSVPACSITIRTARARTSGENLVGLGMAPILSRIGASGKPGRFRRTTCLTVSSVNLAHVPVIAL